MNIERLKEMIARIKQDTGIQIIKSNQKARPPTLPYGVYTVTSPYIKGNGNGSVIQFTQEENTFEKRTEYSKYTISFSFYADDNETTIETAMKVHSWFLFASLYFFQDREMVVAVVGNVQNRTTFVVDDYEYKHGFDVQLRETYEQTRLIEVIERANVTRK